MTDRRIIRGATVVALDGRRVLRRSDVLIENGVVAAIGGVVDNEGALVTDARGVLMPGLIQAHAHLDQTLLDRYFVPDVDPRVYRTSQLSAWLDELDDAAVSLQAEAAFTRGLRTGAVAFGALGIPRLRAYAIRAADRTGVRMTYALDASAPSSDMARDYDEGTAVLQDGGEAGGRIRMAVFAGDAERTPLRRLREAAKFSNDHGVPLVVHIGAMPGDRAGLARLDRAGALGRHLVLVSATGTSLGDASEIAALARAGASVVVTPAFDLFMGAPSPPIEALVREKVNVALGSETGATRIGLDLFTELRLLLRWLAGRVSEPASTALEIATRGGACALGLHSGTLTVGQAADLMLIDVEAEPSDDHELVARRIIVQGEPSIVRTVWVAGQVVFSEGRTTRADPPTASAEESLRARIGFAADRKRRARDAGLRGLARAFFGSPNRALERWHQGQLPFLGDDSQVRDRHGDTP